MTLQISKHNTDIIISIFHRLNVTFVFFHCVQLSKEAIKILWCQ